MAKPHELIETRYSSEETKQRYLRGLFNRGAPYYDRLGRIGSFGTGHAYRKQALRRAGVRPGLEVLDVACGTGAVTRAISELLQGKGRVVGIDPSEGMLKEARSHLNADFRVGHAEALPFADCSFDFLAMGYALRHVQDLESAFAEYHRVLRTGGCVLVLEISQPASRLARGATRLYFRDILPRIASVVTRDAAAREMMEYYWETIEACVPPQAIMNAMRHAGFEDIRRNVEKGMFSEYSGRKP